MRRVKETDAIVKAGTPWFAKYGLTMENCTSAGDRGLARPL